MSSTLPEVYYPPNRDAPEVVVGTDPEAVPRAPDNEGLQAIEHLRGEKTVAGDAASPKTPGRILGLKRGRFWLIVALVITVGVIAVLGGVLGSVLKNRNAAAGGADNSVSSSTAALDAGSQNSVRSSSTSRNPSSGSNSSSGSSSTPGSDSDSGPIDDSDTAGPTATSTTPPAPTNGGSTPPSPTSPAPDPGPGPGAALCPSSDSFIEYDTPDGRLWTVICDRSFGRDPTATAMRTTSAANLEECIKLCGGDGSCVAVDYVRANGSCMLFSKRNDSIGAPGIDSAATINRS